MRFYFFLLLAVVDANTLFSQSILDKIDIYGFVLNPIKPASCIVERPTYSQKGKVVVRFKKPAWFFSYDSTAISRHQEVCYQFFREYVLKDSLAYYDSIWIEFIGDRPEHKDGLLTKVVPHVNKMDMPERIAILVEAMPVHSYIRFYPIDQNKYDVELVILGKDWQISHDFKQMDRYAVGVAVIIYDLILKQKVEQYPSIMVTTLSATDKILHQKRFNTKEKMFKAFYSGRSLL